jgi:hypothetical protein
MLCSSDQAGSVVDRLVAFVVARAVDRCLLDRPFGTDLMTLTARSKSTKQSRIMALTMTAMVILRSMFKSYR